MDHNFLIIFQFFIVSKLFLKEPKRRLIIDKH